VQDPSQEKLRSDDLMKKVMDPGKQEVLLTSRLWACEGQIQSQKESNGKHQ